MSACKHAGCNARFSTKVEREEHERTCSFAASAGSVMVVDILNTAIEQFRFARAEAAALSEIAGHSKQAWGRSEKEWDALISATGILISDKRLPTTVNLPNSILNEPDSHK